MRKHRVRLSFPPLLAASGVADAWVEAHVPNNYPGGGPGHMQKFPSPNGTLAELLGVSLRTVGRWKLDGIPIDDAEDAAAFLGLHPATVWGDEYLFCAMCPLARLTAPLPAFTPNGRTI